MYIKTMAIRITPSTYPVALACLPPGFGAIPVELVLNQALIINSIAPGYTEGGSFTTLENFWQPWTLFIEEYDTVNEDDDTEFFTFTEVVKVRHAEVKDRESKPAETEEYKKTQRILDEFYGRRRPVRGYQAVNRLRPARGYRNSEEF